MFLLYLLRSSAESFLKHRTMWSIRCKWDSVLSPQIGNEVVKGGKQSSNQSLHLTHFLQTLNFHALVASFLGVAGILSHVERKLERTNNGAGSYITWLPRISTALFNFCRSKGWFLSCHYPFFSSWNTECMCLAKIWMTESEFIFHRKNGFLDSLSLQMYMRHIQCWEREFGMETNGEKTFKPLLLEEH